MEAVVLVPQQVEHPRHSLAELVLVPLCRNSNKDRHSLGEAVVVLVPRQQAPHPRPQPLHQDNNPNTAHLDNPAANLTHAEQEEGAANSLLILHQEAV